VSKAIEREREIGGNCGQIFVSSPRSWSVRRPPEGEIDRFKELRQDEDQFPYAVHSKYLVNIGSHNEQTRGRSLAALQNEILVASALEIEYVVFHPGAHTGGLDREAGMDKVSDGIGELDIPTGVKLLLENTAGRGNTLGRDFEELGRMIEGSGQGYKKLGICFDTCHGFCAGHPIHEPTGLEEVLKCLDDFVGLDNLCLIHLNDSKHPFGSNLDEHQLIGMGQIGDEAFRNMLANKTFSKVPKVLETPESSGRGGRWNITKVKELVGII
jgi:deoxyribonuclease-4